MHHPHVVVHIKAPGGARHPGLFHDLRAADWRAVRTLKEFITAISDGRIDTDERWYCVNTYTKTWISMAAVAAQTDGKRNLSTRIKKKNNGTQVYRYMVNGLHLYFSTEIVTNR